MKFNLKENYDKIKEVFLFYGVLVDSIENEHSEFNKSINQDFEENSIDLSDINEIPEDISKY